MSDFFELGNRPKYRQNPQLFFASHGYGGGGGAAPRSTRPPRQNFNHDLAPVHASGRRPTRNEFEEEYNDSDPVRATYRVRRLNVTENRAYGFERNEVFNKETGTIEFWSRRRINQTGNFSSRRAQNAITF